MFVVKLRAEDKESEDVIRWIEPLFTTLEDEYVHQMFGTHWAFMVTAPTLDREAATTTALFHISTLFFHHSFHKYRASARDGLVFFPYSSPFLLAPRRAMAWWTSFGTRPKTNESLEVADSPGGDHSFHS